MCYIPWIQGWQDVNWFNKYCRISLSSYSWGRQFLFLWFLDTLFSHDGLTLGESINKHLSKCVSSLQVYYLLKSKLGNFVKQLLLDFSIKAIEYAYVFFRLAIFSTVIVCTCLVRFAFCKEILWPLRRLFIKNRMNVHEITFASFAIEGELLIAVYLFSRCGCRSCLYHQVSFDRVDYWYLVVAVYRPIQTA